MIRAKLYPKTKRYNANKMVQVTEKLDGSCLGFAKVGDRLKVIQRNMIFESLDEAIKLSEYKGLSNWLKENGQKLEKDICDGSIIFGEWLGTGRIKYGDRFPKKFYIFAKARWKNSNEMQNIVYRPDLLHFAFTDQIVPEYIGQVPEVASVELSLNEIDNLYDIYNENITKMYGRENNVEGFILIQSDREIMKYVRNKNGKITPHTW